MRNDQNKLALGKGLLILLGLIVLFAVIGFGISQYSKKRAEAIYNEYASETNNYIAKNQQGLEILFTDVFDEEKCQKEEYAPTYCFSIDGERISQLISTDLKDWSSTGFIKYSTASGRFYLIRLSGRMTTISPTTDNELYKLLMGKKDKIPWEDYTYEFRGKEVIIPVKDNRGKILGAIVRAVVEDSNDAIRTIVD